MNDDEDKDTFTRSKLETTDPLDTGLAVKNKSEKEGLDASCLDKRLFSQSPIQNLPIDACVIDLTERKKKMALQRALGSKASTFKQLSDDLHQLLVSNQAKLASHEMSVLLVHYAKELLKISFLQDDADRRQVELLKVEELLMEILLR